MNCFNCKREAEPFTLDTGDTAFWFCVPKETGDPVYLWTDESVSWLACTDLEPKEEEKYDYWCVRCIESVNEEEFDERD